MLHTLITLVLLIPLCAGFMLVMLGDGVVEVFCSKHPMAIEELLIVLIVAVGLNGATAIMAIKGLRSPAVSQFLGLGRNTWLFLVLLAFVGGVVSAGYVVFAL